MNRPINNQDAGPEDEAPRAGSDMHPVFSSNSTNDSFTHIYKLLVQGLAKRSAEILGRDAAMATVLEQWAASERSERRTVLITNETGIGKSRLALGLVRRRQAPVQVFVDEAVNTGDNFEGSSAERPARAFCFFLFCQAGAPDFVVTEQLGNHLHKLYQFTTERSVSDAPSALGTLNARRTERHINMENTVALSPDGTYVSYGADDGTLSLCELRTGASRRLVGHSEAVAAVAFSPDGRCIISGSHDNTLRLWDVKSGASRILEGHQGTVDAVAFSCDGRQIVSASRDHTLRIWNIEDLTSHVFKSDDHTANAVAFSPDGRRIVSRSWDSKLHLWEVATGTSCLLADMGNPLNTAVWHQDLLSNGIGLAPERNLFFAYLSNRLRSQKFERDARRLLRLEGGQRRSFNALYELSQLRASALERNIALLTRLQLKISDLLADLIAPDARSERLATLLRLIGGPRRRSAGRHKGDTQTGSFSKLVKKAGLDPLRHLRFADWSGVNFRYCDLRGFDFTGARLINCDFSHALIEGARFDQAEIGIKRENTDSQVSDITRADDWVLYAETWTKALRRFPDLHLETGAIFVDAPLGPQMVVVPPGRFVRRTRFESAGDPTEENGGETIIPRRFAVAWSLITVEQWNASVVHANDRRSGEPSDPVVEVSWNDARRYVDWLSERTGRSYRLLTEVEWEYCARAGTRALAESGPEEMIARVLAEHRTGETQPLPNPYGLYEMHGSVWEWCRNEEGNTDSDEVSEGIVRRATNGFGLSARREALAAKEMRSIGFRVARDLID